MVDNPAFEFQDTAVVGSVDAPEQPDTLKDNLIYTLLDNPPWYMTIVLAFQQYLTMFGGALAVTLVVSGMLCVGNNYLAQTELVGTMLVVSGISTLLQTILGNRLPIVQGGSFAYLSPVGAIMTLPQWECPAQLDSMNNTLNLTDDAWKPRMCEVQGAIILASLFEVLVGGTGLIGFLIRFIGPLTIAPTIALVGLSLVETAVQNSSVHWGIAIGTAGLIAVFSQYMRNVELPVCMRQEGKWKKSGVKIFTLFPVLLSIALIWLLCYTLTITGVLPSDPNVRGYGARTDIKSHVLDQAPWFRMPYPGQWGLPTVSAGAVFGMLAGVFGSMTESIGDYFACARLSGAPPPPTHAINRGIFVEGLGCVLAGAIGSGVGTTSYSQNVGAIGITRVGSRRVVQVAGVIMIILGVFGKFGALFVTLPEPIIGGVIIAMFGIVTAVGLSNLQFVDLNSPRNLFVVGVSIVMGLAVPMYMTNPENRGIINTGSPSVDQIIQVLLSTSMFVGGVLACFLDNTIPGSPQERGLTVWNVMTSQDVETSPYDLPFRSSRFLRRVKLFHRVPFCPVFTGCVTCPKCRREPEITTL